MTSDRHSKHGCGLALSASLAFLGALLVVVSIRLNAQDRGTQYNPDIGANWRMPCGGPCVFDARIIRLDRFSQENIVRALVETSRIRQGNVTANREWWFADCTAQTFGEGYKSDGSDARFKTVYYYSASGERLEADGGSWANKFSRWQGLCNYRP